MTPREVAELVVRSLKLHGVDWSAIGLLVVGPGAPRATRLLRRSQHTRRAADCWLRACERDEWDRARYPWIDGAANVALITSDAKQPPTVIAIEV